MRSTVVAAAAFVAAFSVVLQAPRTARAADYHWAPSGGPTSWPAPGNWSPPRFTPQATDRIFFDGGGAYDVISVPNQTIGQLVVSNGTTVTLNANFAGNNLTIAGDTGPDLLIAAGAYLYLGGLNTLNVNLGTGATAAISGFFGGNGGSHHLQAVDVDAIEFLAGSVGLGSVGFTGNLFGDGTGASALNSVRFRAGSSYWHVTGANPFGAAQPNTVVNFDPGSLYKLNATINPSLSGRTYANFEYNGPGAITATGSAACSIDSIVVNSGSVSLEPTGALKLRGSIRVRNNALLKLGPSTGSVIYTMNGAATQIIADSSSATVPLDATSWLVSGLRLAPSVQLAIDNPAGVRVTNAPTTLIVPGSLKFVHGLLSIEEGTALWLGTTGSIVSASSATGWVDGYVYYYVYPGGPARTIDIGTAVTHTPVDLAFHGMTDTTYIQVSSRRDPTNPSYLPDYGTPYFAGAQLDTLRNANLGYRLAIGGGTTFTNLDATFHFNASDLDAAADPAQFVVREKHTNGVWHSTVTGVRTATSIAATGISPIAANDYISFGIGQPSVVSVSVRDSSKAEGTGTSLPLKLRVVLSEPAVDPVAVNYTTVSGSALPGSDYGTTAGTISFAPGNTTFYVTVPVTPDAVPEPDEAFFLVLSNPFRAILDRDTATGTILDDDDASPPVVTVLAPNGGETILVGEDVNLQWSATDSSGVAGVDLELSRDDGGTWETIATSLPNTGHHGWAATGPLTQLARFRVTATDTHGHSAADASDAVWSIWSADPVEDALPQAFALSFASANPGAGTSRIRYALPREQDVRMSIVDVRGRVVAVLANGVQPAGVYVASWDPGNAPAGIYFVRFRTRDWQSQLRLVHL
jgi:hypothetical protein